MDIFDTDGNRVHLDVNCEDLYKEYPEAVTMLLLKYGSIMNAWKQYSDVRDTSAWTADERNVIAAFNDSLFDTLFEELPHRAGSEE